jgi:hypothetical protein
LLTPHKRTRETRRLRSASERKILSEYKLSARAFELWKSRTTRFCFLPRRERAQGFLGPVCSSRCCSAGSATKLTSLSAVSTPSPPPQITGAPAPAVPPSSNKPRLGAGAGEPSSPTGVRARSVQVDASATLYSVLLQVLRGQLPGVFDPVALALLTAATRVLDGACDILSKAARRVAKAPSPAVAERRLVGLRLEVEQKLRLTSAGANFRGAGVDAAAEAAARSLCEPPFLLYVGGLPAHASADTARLLVEAHVARGEAVLAVRVSGQRRNEAGEYAIAFAEFESAAALLTAAAVPNVALPLAEGEPAWKQRRLTIDVATPEQKAAHAARVAEDAASRTTLEEVAFRTACSFRL